MSNRKKPLPAGEAEGFAVNEAFVRRSVRARPGDAPVPEDVAAFLDGEAENAPKRKGKAGRKVADTDSVHSEPAAGEEATEKGKRSVKSVTVRGPGPDTPEPIGDPDTPSADGDSRLGRSRRVPKRFDSPTPVEGFADETPGKRSNRKTDFKRPDAPPAAETNGDATPRGRRAPAGTPATPAEPPVVAVAEPVATPTASDDIGARSRKKSRQFSPSPEEKAQAAGTPTAAMLLQSRRSDRRSTSEYKRAGAEEAEAVMAVVREAEAAEAAEVAARAKSQKKGAGRPPAAAGAEADGRQSRAGQSSKASDDDSDGDGTPLVVVAQKDVKRNRWAVVRSTVHDGPYPSASDGKGAGRKVDVKAEPVERITVKIKKAPQEEPLPVLRIKRPRGPDDADVSTAASEPASEPKVVKMKLKVRAPQGPVATAELDDDKPYIIKISNLAPRTVTGPLESPSNDRVAVTVPGAARPSPPPSEVVKRGPGRPPKHPKPDAPSAARAKKATSPAPTPATTGERAGRGQKRKRDDDADDEAPPTKRKVGRPRADQNGDAEAEAEEEEDEPVNRKIEFGEEDEDEEDEDEEGGEEDVSGDEKTTKKKGGTGRKRGRPPKIRKDGKKSEKPKKDDDAAPATDDPQGALKATLMKLWRSLSRLDKEKLFAMPVDLDEVVGYRDLISHPMDFNTMKDKIGEGTYTALEEFLTDFRLIVTNAMTYNEDGSYFYNAAKTLEEKSRQAIVRTAQELGVEPPDFPEAGEGAGDAGDEDGAAEGEGGEVVYVQEAPNLADKDKYQEDVIEESYIEPMVEEGGKPPSKKCAFCRVENSFSEVTGPFMARPFLSRGKRAWAHENCARFAPESYQSPEGKWYNLAREVTRAGGLKCAKCSERGAALGCLVQRCNKTFHIACTGKPLSFFENHELFFCPTHENSADARAIQAQQQQDAALMRTDHKRRIAIVSMAPPPVAKRPMAVFPPRTMTLRTPQQLMPPRSTAISTLPPAPSPSAPTADAHKPADVPAAPAAQPLRVLTLPPKPPTISRYRILAKYLDHDAFGSFGPSTDSTGASLDATQATFLYTDSQRPVEASAAWGGLESLVSSLALGEPIEPMSMEEPSRTTRATAAHSEDLSTLAELGLDVSWLARSANVSAPPPSPRARGTAVAATAEALLEANEKLLSALSVKCARTLKPPPPHWACGVADNLTTLLSMAPSSLSAPLRRTAKT